MVLQLDGTLDEIREQLDPDEFPETVACLDNLQDEDFGGLYELASELVNCDKTKEMPQFLFDFIVFLYKECIEGGDDRAMCDLGALYYMGRNGHVDFGEAFRYYEMAADKGNRQAHENLGY